MLLAPTDVPSITGAAVREVFAGQRHSAAVTDSGECWTWGEGDSGKLGQGNCANHHLPTRQGWLFSTFGPDHNNFLFVLTCKAPGRVEALVGRANITAVALGHEHSLFLDARGAVCTKLLLNDP